MGRSPGWNTEQLDIYSGLSKEDAGQIAHRTTQEILPRLAETAA